ncbi:MAG: hypothetical protein JNJ94_11280 [Chlorobi bacterium]|nr:hypothetical protein [Chlorobiota bacterium]
MLSTKLQTADNKNPKIYLEDSAMNLTFGENLNRAIAASRTEAIRLGHLFINTDDLLLGILSVDGDESVATLQHSGCNIGQLQNEIENDSFRQQVDANAAAVSGLTLQSNRNVMLTDLTERVMKDGMQRAFSSGQFSTRHLMQAILADAKNPAAERMMKYGVTTATFA